MIYNHFYRKQSQSDTCESVIQQCLKWLSFKIKMDHMIPYNGHMTLLNDHFFQYAQHLDTGQTSTHDLWCVKQALYHYTIVHITVNKYELLKIIIKYLW